MNLRKVTTEEVNMESFGEKTAFTASSRETGFPINF